VTRILVVGGGLAGISAALAAADAGATVTLLESRPRLGGATTSFRRGDLHVDNGQHVFLRCCTAYRSLLSRIGSADDVTIQRRLDIPVVLGDGRRARLRRSALPLPTPLHLAGALATYRAIPLRERASVAMTALRLGRVDIASADAETFGGWLARRHQSPRAVAALWSLVTVATLNTPVDEASLALAAMVFQTGLLAEPDAADIGWAAVPLSRLHGDASLTALRRAGVDVRLATRVRRVDGASAATDAGVVRADAVVVAVPHDMAARLLPDGVAEGAGRLADSPILNSHLVLDRPVLDVPFTAVVDGDLQWVFDRTAIGGAARGQYLAASISAGDRLARLPVDALRARLLPQFRAAFPRMASAEVLDFFVTREPAATFRQAAGTAALRPGAVTRSPGLFLAGAWTDTGWPATMEGAVRSGTMAVAAALAATGSLPGDRARREGALA
jgi:squalene-associated FAD-dependent desaturase